MIELNQRRAVMKKATKIWIIVATSLILTGAIIFVGVMMVFKWDFTRLSTLNYETNEYEITEDLKATQRI